MSNNLNQLARTRSSVVKVDVNARQFDFLLIIVILLVGFLAMPLVYGWATFGPGLVRHMNGDILNHVILNCCAQTLVMLAATRTTGRLDRKLAAILSVMIVVHGGLAFYILITRSFYSNSVMLIAVGMSSFLGMCVTLVKHRATRVRIAVLGPNEPADGQIRFPYDRITDPSADLRPYDVLLTTTVTDLSPEWASVLSRAMVVGKPVRHVAEFIEDQEGLVSVDHFDLDHLPAHGLTSYHARKRVFDIVLSLLFMPLALILLSFGAIIVLVTMGRPILFFQRRAGQGGITFNIFKLRTMRQAADVNGMTTASGDLRITPAGRFLRRFRIDEIPQIFNVLRGHMSIIGPRPEWVVLSDRYSHDLPVYTYRHLVRPGITGWAQVRGGYASDLAETRVKVGYDLYYIKNLSFALDMQILMRTVWTLLSGGGVR